MHATFEMPCASTWFSQGGACTCARRAHVLAYTSLLLALPAWRLPNGPLQLAVRALLVSSILYHITHTRAMRIVDVLLTRLVLLLALAQGVESPVALVMLAVIAWIHTSPSCYQDRCLEGPYKLEAHALVHGCAALGLLALC